MTLVHLLNVNPKFRVQTISKVTQKYKVLEFGGAMSQVFRICSYQCVI